MKDIKFRWKEYYSNKWVYGYLIEIDWEKYILKNIEKTNETNKALVEYQPIYYKVKSDTIWQFIGILDKDGKEIFENDIVEILEGAKLWIVEYVTIENMKFICEDWKMVWFYVKDKDWNYWYFSHDVKVVWNIFDNKKLIK